MLQILKRTPLIVLALFIMAASINFFLAPHQIAAGGVNGIGILLESAMGIHRSITVLVLNSILLVFAFIFLGRPIFTKSLIGSLLLPVTLAIVPEITLVQDRFLSMVVGSAVFALAVAILYRNEASSGGTTIPPLIFQKKFGLNTAIGLLATDMVVVVFNIFVFGFDSFFYALVSLVITAMVMTYLETGMRRNKAVAVTSHEKIEEIHDAISARIKTRMTLMEAINGLSNQKKTVLTVILDDKDYPALIHLIDSIDHDATMIAYNVAAVHGTEVFKLREGAQDTSES